MGQPTARILDPCSCQLHGSAAPGAPSGRQDVTVNSSFAQLMGSCRNCSAGPNQVLGGSAIVKINGHQILRASERAFAHDARFTVAH